MERPLPNGSHTVFEIRPVRQTRVLVKVDVQLQNCLNSVRKIVGYEVQFYLIVIISLVQITFGLISLWFRRPDFETDQTRSNVRPCDLCRCYWQSVFRKKTLKNVLLEFCMYIVSFHANLLDNHRWLCGLAFNTHGSPRDCQSTEYALSSHIYL